MKHLFTVCFLLLSLWAMPAQAVVLLEESWEGSCSDVSGRWSLGNYYNTANGGFPCGWGIYPSETYQPFFLDSSVYLFGSQSLRYNYKGVQYNGWYLANGSADKYFSSTATEIWITFYNRMSAGFQTAGGALGGAATKGPYQYMISSKCNVGNTPTVGGVSCSTPGAIPQQNGWVFHYMWGGRQLLMTAQGIKDSPPYGGQPHPYETQNLSQNIQPFNQPDLKWVCYEAHIRLNTGGQANGLYEQYATNVSDSGPTILTSRYLNREFLGSTISDKMPSDAAWYLARTYRQDGLGSMWYDKITYSTTRVGCTGGGGSAGDTTAPATPSISSIAKTSTTATVTFTATTDATMGNFLILRCTPTACTSHTQVGSVNYSGAITTYTFTNSGLTAGTVYSYRVRAQDQSGNLSPLSTAMEVTTNASSALPTISAFDATSSGGTVTWSTSPTTSNLRFKYGGGTTSAQFERTVAQVPGGVLTFQWPQTTTWACVEAGNAVPTYNTASDAYRCDAVSPQAAIGAGLVKVNTVNGRYLQAGSNTRALYLTGRSSGNNCNAALCGLHDWMVDTWTDLIRITDNSDTFDGTSTDIATSPAVWSTTPGNQSPLTKVSGVIQPTNMVGSANNAELYEGFQEADQFRCITLGTFNDAGFAKAGVQLRYSLTADTGMELRAARNTTYTTRVISVVAGTATVLSAENATAWAAGDELCGQAVGSQYRVFRNGTEIAAVATTHSTHKHGYSGIMLGGTNAASSTTVTSTRAGRMGADVDAGLDAIIAQGQNYVRTWRQEQTTWGDAAAIAANTTSRIPLQQMPWLLTGTRLDTTSGTTVQVGVYDLDVFNQSWFDKVRAFVISANAKGITPSIMLFSPGHQSYTTYPGFSHPMSCPTAARCNNEQGINGDTNGDGKLEETYLDSTLNPVLPIQVAYVNKMVDTLHDLDGFVFEVGNELFANGTSWHNDIYNAIRAREAAQGYQAHLVVYSMYGWSPQVQTSNEYLFANSKPEIVTPSNIGSDNYITNPPDNDGRKVVLLDSDHLSGAMPTLWPWKVFLRGMYPVLLGLSESAGELSTLLTQMAQTRVYAEKMDLVNMYPEETSATDIFSTSYGLSKGTTTRCSEYLLLIPTDAAGTIDLSKYNCTGSTTFDVEYFNITSGATSSGGTTTGGAVRSFNPTGSDPMVVYLKSQSAPADTTAPVLSGGFPTGILAAGTTSTSMNVISTEVCEARYDNSPSIAHASKATAFSTTDVTSHTTTVGSLTNGSTHLKYVTCEDPSGNVSLEYPISWSVEAAADTTNDGTISALGGISTASDTAILWELTEGTQDANHSHYILEIAVGGQGDIFTPPAIITIVLDDSLTYTQQGLVAGNSYIARARAVDTSGNVSAWTTSNAVNVALPETMTGLTESALYTNSAIITVTEAAQQGVIGTYELCTGAACNSGWTSAGIPAGLSVTFSSLSPNTTYGVRGKWVNTALGGISADWSSTFYFTTAQTVSSGGTGIFSGPRNVLPFGTTRGANSGGAAGARPARP